MRSADLLVVARQHRRPAQLISISSMPAPPCAHAPSPSQRNTRPKRCSRPSPETRGRREARTSTEARGPPAEKNAGGRNHRFSRTDPAFPARWVNVCSELSPGTGFLAPVTSATRHVTQAWRQHRDARTTRLERPRADSRLAQQRLTDPRPPLPASPYRDDAHVPLHEAGWGEESIISANTKERNFRADIWTGVIVLSTLRNYRFRRIRGCALARTCDGGSAVQLVFAARLSRPSGRSPQAANEHGPHGCVARELRPLPRYPGLMVRDARPYRPLDELDQLHGAPHHEEQVKEERGAITFVPPQQNRTSC